MRKRPKRRMNGKSIHWGGGFFVFCLACFMMTVLYLWGKVHIEFDIRQAEELAEKRNSLEREINDLKIEVNSLKSYKRIVALAKAQGLVFLEPSLIAEIEVDLKGIEWVPRRDSMPYHVAGLGFPFQRRLP